MHFYSLDEVIILDEATRINLELTEKMRNSSEKGSLLQIIDKTIAPIRKRLIKQWINQPLINHHEIIARLDLVESFIDDSLLRSEIVALLKGMADVERIINRVNAGHSNPRELVMLRITFEKLPALESLLATRLSLFNSLNVNIQTCKQEYELLQKAIADDSPATLQNCGVIRQGYSEELDRILESTNNSR